eukprot:14618687-Alexandrium_andersonii.AAC.1
MLQGKFASLRPGVVAPVRPALPEGPKGAPQGSVALKMGVSLKGLFPGVFGLFTGALFEKIFLLFILFALTAKR